MGQLTPLQTFNMFTSTKSLNLIWISIQWLATHSWVIQLLTHLKNKWIHFQNTHGQICLFGQMLKLLIGQLAMKISLIKIQQCLELDSSHTTSIQMQIHIVWDQHLFLMKQLMVIITTSTMCWKIKSMHLCIQQLVLKLFNFMAYGRQTDITLCLMLTLMLVQQNHNSILLKQASITTMMTMIHISSMEQLLMNMVALTQLEDILTAIIQELAWLSHLIPTIGIWFLTETCIATLKMFWLTDMVILGWVGSFHQTEH